MRVSVRWLRRLPLCLGALLCTALAQPRTDMHQLDARRSHAGFEVKVLWLIGVHGEFGAVHGRVMIDHFRGTARVDAWINADDLHMRSRHYTNWARSAEFFDAGRYPQIHFLSTDFPLVRMRNGGNVDGTLTIRGIDRHVRFRLIPSRCDRPISGLCAVRAQGEIRRSDFGMHAHRHTLSDQVQLQLSIFVKRQPPAAAS